MTGARSQGHPQTPLANALRARISHDGPISVAEYVEACLHDPQHGYYRRQAAIGAAGDFITAPEISQVFGEIIGLWCAVVWQQMGAPPAVRLVELGPGRGTLMHDALRATRLVPAFRAALSVDLVESNATLAAIQKSTLSGESGPVRWSRDLAPSSSPTIVIANEFLDTFPVEQFVFRNGAWHTRCVSIDAEGELAFTDRPLAPGIEVATGMPPPCEGDILSTHQRAFANFSGQLAACGTPLAALFIDYGHAEPGFGDTLQAVAAHRYADPFQDPGEADLTAQIDFSAFANAVRSSGLACDGPLPQAEFLGRLGAVERASRLMAANPDRAASIEAGMARLMAPTGMGGRFQVIGTRSLDVSPLPALATVGSQ